MPNHPSASFGNFAFFPLAFEKTGASLQFSTQRIGNERRTVFFAERKSGLWVVSLGGLKILASYIDQWDAFHDMTKGAWKPFLFRLQSRRFEVFKEQPGGIGMGNGVQTAFQLVKTSSYEYGPVNQSRQIVKYPAHNYPPMKVPVGNGEGTLLYPTALVRIWVNGVEKAWLDGWDLDRETGLVTFTAAPANGAPIQAACKFYIAVHGQDEYALELSGGSYQFPSGATLLQVPGENEVL